MWPRLSIPAGLLTGVAAAALVIGGILAFVPEPGAAPTPPPEPSTSFGLPPASSSATAAPSVEGSGAPSGDASPSGGDGPFHIGETAPALDVPQVGGGRIDLTNLRGKPVWSTSWGRTAPRASTGSRS